MKTRRVSIRFAEPAHSALVAESARLGITVSDLVRRVVDEWRTKRVLTMGTVDRAEFERKWREAELQARARMDRITRPSADKTVPKGENTPCIVSANTA